MPDVSLANEKEGIDLIVELLLNASKLLLELRAQNKELVRRLMAVEKLLEEREQ